MRKIKFLKLKSHIPLLAIVAILILFVLPSFISHGWRYYKCNSLGRGDLTELCMIHGKITQDTNCETMEYDTSKQFCYVTIAALSKDPSVCLRNSGMSDDCYSSYAAGFMNFSVCKNVTNAYKRESCYSGAIEKLEEANNAILQKAGMKDKSVLGIDCNRIYSEPDSLTLCRAITTNEPRYCNNIADIELKLACNEKMNAVQRTQDTTLCNGFQDEIERNKCLLKIARTTGNVSICESLYASKKTRYLEERVNEYCMNDYTNSFGGTVGIIDYEGKKLVVIKDSYCLVGPYADELSKRINQRVNVEGEYIFTDCPYGVDQSIYVTEVY